VELPAGFRYLETSFDFPRQTMDGEPSDIALRPELRATSQRSWTSFDLVVSVMAVKLHLYDSLAHSEQQLKEHGIARFALNGSTLRYKALSDGSGEAQVVLKSFTMSNTRPGANAFREIIPAAQHDRNQFMLLYTMANGPTSTSLAVLTVDSPKIILAVDPIISLLEFISSPFVTPGQGRPAATSSPSQTLPKTARAYLTRAKGRSISGWTCMTCLSASWKTIPMLSRERFVYMLIGYRYRNKYAYC
jgi:hypothetical protein